MQLFSEIIRRISDWWLAISVLLGFAVLQILTIGYMLPIPFAALITDVLLFSTLYALVGVLLWYTLKYANFNTLSRFQQFIIYAALVLLSLALIIGIAIGVYFYFPFEGSRTLLEFISVRILITLLVIILLLQHFTLKVCETATIEIPVEEQIDNFQNKKIENEKTAVDVLERITVKSGTKIHLILIPDIVYIQSDGDYVQIFTDNGKYLKEQTMKSFEESLPPSLFARVHRSFIVNVHSIARIELYDKQNQQLTLKNGHQIKVSQAGYKMLRAKLGL